ncbi:heptaprenyl diphosphate synthase component II [Fictibacillus sp. WQ 8-8]|uniref:heptaprenyl diphosphate synthase component II n=1 Tax=unclassified Fictibacillus TaxID=2644029 RepID=UPI00210B8656|nr:MULTISPECIES: heptaprenyl diphosphate synthase component II [unclassified Fictibacillus]MCQ6266028.1 heptaprenyl diphosphate synthase component II [Fictibacillus sp. WQ 8-8]MED2972752.1 heptaprenyl diphosphate synthase component II [Fictibacillus sp. B-59209]
MKLTELYSHVKKDLLQIESELEQSISADHPILQKAGSQLLKAGGKRIRPVFVLLSAHFGEYDIRSVKKVAAALETIHMASLVHDDVIDDAELRRGAKTVKAEYDNKVAMYTGDFLFAKAIEMMTNVSQIAAHQVLSYSMKEMCLGEIQQIKEQFDLDQNIRQYLRRIKRKTALLIAISCQLGAIASNASVQLQRQLYRFGYSVGMAYQITDDILDFTATEKELGKPAGGDLKQGNITLPVFYAMDQIPELKGSIQRYYQTWDEGEFSGIIAQIKKSGSIQKASMAAQSYLADAFAAADQLPAGQARNSMIKIAKYIGKRKF